MGRREWASHRDNVIFVEKGENVTKYQMMADVTISDTSSAIYEFLLLGRPVITLRAISKDIYWENITDPSELTAAFDRVQNDPESIDKMQWVQQNYDPHLDGLCCHRMLEAARDYISRHGVPAQRKLNLWRKYAGIKTFGKL